MNRFCMKLFGTVDTRVIKYCQEQFHLELPSVTLICLTNNCSIRCSRHDNFVIKVMYIADMLLLLFTDIYNTVAVSTVGYYLGLPVQRRLAG